MRGRGKSSVPLLSSWVWNLFSTSQWRCQSGNLGKRQVWIDGLRGRQALTWSAFKAIELDEIARQSSCLPTFVPRVRRRIWQTDQEEVPAKTLEWLLLALRIKSKLLYILNSSCTVSWLSFQPLLSLLPPCTLPLLQLLGSIWLCWLGFSQDAGLGALSAGRVLPSHTPHPWFFTA